MNLTKKMLEGAHYSEPLEFINFDCDTLEIFRSSNSWSVYALEFNGAFESFKTFRGLKTRAEKLISKYKLKLALDGKDQI
jgi:hypothetical protein